MAALKPKEGFDWTRVKWGGPHDVVTESCSYCEAPLDDDDVPLILWNGQGASCRFCEDCMVQWWGFEPKETVH